MKTFLLEEAHSLLPVLRSLLKQAMDSKKMMEAIDKEFEDLNHRIFLNGGTLVNIAHVAGRRAEKDKAVQRIKDSLQEIDAAGVQVKDLDTGLLDFPCDVDGEIILLCWKWGEDKITHYHGMEEGFAGRKPITEHIAKQKKRPQ